MVIVSRSELLSAVGEGKCAAAIMRMEDYHTATSEGGFCHLQPVGREVGIWPVGVPVSRRFHRAIQQGFLESREIGVWLDAEYEYEPEDACGAIGSNDGKDKDNWSLAAIDMLGPFVITGALMIGALLFDFVYVFRPRE